MLYVALQQSHQSTTEHLHLPVCRILNEAERRKREQKQKVVAEKKRVAVVKDGIGEFESYTKGVASKMMEKMG